MKTGIVHPDRAGFLYDKNPLAAISGIDQLHGCTEPGGQHRAEGDVGLGKAMGTDRAKKDEAKVIAQFVQERIER